MKLKPLQTHYQVKPQFANAWLNTAQYQHLYQQSIEQPDEFWAGQARQFIDWRKPFSKVKETSFAANNIDIKWFADGYLNVCENCIDRHLPHRGEQVAMIFEGNEPNNERKYTYRQMHAEVCKLANALKSLGVKKGDVVCVYLPMIPEAVFAMLACARIGAPHSVIFGGYSPEAIAGRIKDSNAKVIITADGSARGAKIIDLKANVDAAIGREDVNSVEKVLVVKHCNNTIQWNPAVDMDFRELCASQSTSCDVEVMNAEDPLFILYTSGSTGAPKGVVHTSGGYLLWAQISFKYVFDYRDGDVFWCGADVGWITGHTYVVYAPLASGATMLMYEGLLNYPSPNRCAQIIDRHNVATFYTAPTAIRALMADGEAAISESSRKSLRLLATAGEPINPEAWHFFYEAIGNGACPIMDTYWQTETGGTMLTPLAGVNVLKPGAAIQPFLGIKPALVDNKGRLIEGEGEGSLVILDSWPGQARTVYGDHQRFETTYFAAVPNAYFTGDGARRDADGEYWITGRVDDVLNVSGHRLGTAELESALVEHHDVAEAAVVGYEHAIKGQGIYAYVALMAGATASDELVDELRAKVRANIGAIAVPDFVQIAKGLPKTRSGKIMRRILRKIANDEYQQLGDISTLAEPEVVADLIANRLNTNN